MPTEPPATPRKMLPPPMTTATSQPSARHLLDLAHHAHDGRAVDAVGVVAHQGFARQLEQDALVRRHAVGLLDRPRSAAARIRRGCLARRRASAAVPVSFTRRTVYAHCAACVRIAPPLRGRHLRRDLGGEVVGRFSMPSPTTYSVKPWSAWRGRLRASARRSACRSSRSLVVQRLTSFRNFCTAPVDAPGHDLGRLHRLALGPRLVRVLGRLQRRRPSARSRPAWAGTSAAARATGFIAATCMATSLAATSSPWYCTSTPMRVPCR